MRKPQRHKGHKEIFKIFLSLCLCGFLIACSRSEKKATTPEPVQEQVVRVTAAQSITREVPTSIQASGSLAANESSDIAAETSGQVVATPVGVGSFVGKGGVIARLDDRDARIRLQEAVAAEQQAAAAVRQAEARIGLDRTGHFNVAEVPDVRMARQEYEAAEAQADLAEAEARRYSNLVETGDVSRSLSQQKRAQADTARAQARAARQRYEMAVNSSRQLLQAVNVARAQQKAAQAQVALAQKAVNDTIITASFGGYISDRPIAVGEYVTPASKIVTLLHVNPIKLNLQVPEADAGRVRPGMAVKANVAAYPNRDFDGRITAINPAVDVASRTTILEVSIENSANLLHPGMFSTARIMLPQGKPVVFIPRSAVLTDPNTNSNQVFVIENQTARVRVVQPGDQDGEQIQIVSGLSAGEVVATSNLDKLFDGVKVQIE